MNTQSCRWFGRFIKGFLLIVLGILAISMPVLTAHTLNVILGWLFAVGGVSIIIATLTQREGSVFLYLLLGVLLLLCGLFLLLKPLAGLLTLSTILTVYLFTQGMLTLIMWVAIRKLDGAGWIGLNGLLSLLLAVLILSQWPLGGLVYIGIVIGIHLIFWGSAEILFSLAKRV